MADRSLLSPRWLLGHALIGALVAGFVTLGFWQLDRWEEEKALAATLEARLDATPVALGEVVGRPPAEVTYTTVTATGRYVVDEEVLLRSRVRKGVSGYHVLTPLRLDDGRHDAVLVVRGWVPFELDTPPVPEARPPGGELTVTGWVQPGSTQPDGMGPRDPASGRLERMFHADVDRLAEQTGLDLAPLVVYLTEQSPAGTGRLPRPLEPPTADPDQNLSYAIQWFAFALTAAIGYGWLLRTRRGAATPAPDPGREPTADEQPVGPY